MATRPSPRNAVRLAAAAGACVGLFAVAQHHGSPRAAAAPDRFGGLSASFDGRAFTTGEDGGPPRMVLSDLHPGQAVSGSVTVRNPGSQSRYFWLTPGAASERLGAAARLTSALSLSVLDVSDPARPTSLYRGALTAVGAQPLGFLAPGARRTFSFSASLPADAAAGEPGDPFRGARLEQTWDWQSIAARPSGTQLAATHAPPRDRTAPRVRFAMSHVQDVLTAGTLRVDSSCSEPCRVDRLGATMRLGSVTWPLGVSRTGDHATVRFGPQALGALRSALQAGTAAPVRIEADARDRAGNRGTSTHTVTLRPQG